MSTYRVTTSVIHPDGHVSSPVDLDGDADQRRDRLSALDLRNSYVVTLCSGVEGGATVTPEGRYGFRVMWGGIGELVDVQEV